MSIRCLASCVPITSLLGLCGCLVVSTPELLTLGATVVDGDMLQVDDCEDVSSWPVEWSDYEDDVLTIVNSRRAQGADCGSRGYFPPTSPLTNNSALQCAARNHSRDMSERNYFGHTNPDGEGGGDRISDAGYVFALWGENIARGQRSPSSVVDAWMSSDGHCANIMNSEFTETGVGYYTGHHWTQVFATTW